jgi:NAD(P)-dependent dehydrogenase (short-subunit alcohol dehydrogenase family)
MTTAPAPSLAALLSLHGSTAVVTGAARGIGRACAAVLAEAGARVWIVDVDEDAGTTAAHAIGGRFVQADVSRAEDATKTIDLVTARDGRIDVLVNNAGVFPMRAFLDVDEALWDRVLDTNLKGAFFFAQAAARHMARGPHGGSIVNVASIDALHPTGRLTAYDASKGGLVMLTRALALELAPLRIRVNAVCPGGVDTPGADAATATMARQLGTTVEALRAGSTTQRVPLGRLGQPDDIARAVLFFATALSSWVTGDVMVVDGGRLLT